MGNSQAENFAYLLHLGVGNPLQKTLAILWQWANLAQSRARLLLPVLVNLQLNFRSVMI